MNPPISMVSEAKKTRCENTHPMAVIKAIRSNRYRPAVEKIRATYAEVLAKTGDPDKAKEGVKELKKALPGILVSGKFSKRCNKGLLDHSGLLCADLDHLDVERITELRPLLTGDPHVYALFTSPTATGLKVWFRVPNDPAKHLASYFAVRKYCRIWGVEVDDSCKDVARLCFVSYDPAAYLNPDAFELLVETIPLPKENATPPPADHPVPNGNPPPAAALLLANGAPSGERNTKALALACQLRDAGLDQQEASRKILEYAARCQPPLDPTEALAVVKSAFSRPPRAPAIPAAPSLEFNLTDYGNAERLAFHHGNEFRYCPAWGKWLVWDGVHWASDDTGLIIRLAKDTVRRIYSEADAIQVSVGASKEEREALLKRRESIARHAVRSESSNALAAMVKLAESEEGLPVLPEHLDADPFAFNVQNGTLELRDGTLKPHTRGDLITKLSLVTFDAAATCPKWENFLVEIMGGDMAMATYLQRAAGYSLTADVREQCLFFPYGIGANGKSTFTGILELLAGDYFQKAPKSLIQLRSMGDEGIPTELADLKGARLVVCNEIEEGKRLAESQVKDLTGGDTVVARRMRQDFFRFAPTHKLWIYGNHRPVIRGNDFGIWRRIHLIPFDVCIAPEKRDLLLRDKLRAELSGILNWALEGCLAWQRLGLRPPEKVFAATDEYRQDMDVIGQFIEDYCRLDAKGWTPSARLYRAYADWAQKNGENTLGQRNFGQRLRDRGFIPFRTPDGSRGWKGIELIIEPNAITFPAYDYAEK